MVNDITVHTRKEKEVVDLTDSVNNLVSRAGIKEGICLLFVMHTTCCLTTGEFGEGTAQDLLDVAQKVIPSIDFRHAHNPEHAWAHMSASLIGPSLTLPISQRKLSLGSWQSVLMLEFDGPRERMIKVILME